MALRTIVLFYLTFNFTFLLACCDKSTPGLHNFPIHQNYSTVRCINNILKKYFLCGTLTTFVNNNADVDQVIKAGNEADCHSIIVRTFEHRDWFIWTYIYVITVEDLFELWSGILDLSRDLFWNPRARFIIQVNNIDNEDDNKGDNEEIQKVFKTLLKYRMCKVVLLHVVKYDAVIYTYRPLENHGCGKHFDKVITLGTCENAQNIVDYFPTNGPHHLRNCTIKVVASDDVPNFISKASNYTVYGKYVSGLEQFVLDTIAEKEEFSIDYEIFGAGVTYGVVLKNRTSTGLLNYIDKDKADIAAGGYILMNNRVQLFDYLWGFNYGAYFLFTPARTNQTWKRVYREFGLTTWLLIAAAIFLVILVGEVLKKRFRDETFSVLNLWGYFFGNAGRGLSKHKKFRMITMSWAWFTFYINSFYNTALFSLVTIHVHETPHSLSVGNLKSLPFEPCISANSRLVFQYAYNQDLPIGEANPKCTSTDSSLQYVAHIKKNYAIEMEYSYKLKEEQYLNDLGKPKLDSWIFSNTNVIVMYLARGFPFIKTFQKYAQRLYEAGLITNHMKTISLRSYSVIQRHPKAFTATTIQDLRMHFAILFVGQILSFVCFLLEISYNYIKAEMQFKRMVTTNKFKRRTDGGLRMQKQNFK